MRASAAAVRAAIEGESFAAPADVGDPAALLAAIDAAERALGPVDGLFANAGTGGAFAPFADYDDAAFEEVLRINLESALAMLGAWIGSRRTAQQPGAAVLVSSVVGQIGVANHEAIAAAKAGIDGLVRSAAATYAAQGLRINAVAPGMTDTPQ